MLAEVKLEKPVTAHDQQIDVLKFREPNGGDLMALPLEFDGNAFKPATVELAASLAGVPPSTIKSLCAKDAFKVMAVVNPFVVECLVTLQP